MPYSIELIHNGTGIACIGRDVTTAQEIIDATRALATWGPVARRLTHAVVDLTSVTDLLVTAAQVTTIIEVDRTIAWFIPKLEIAIIAPADAIYGVARMYQSHDPVPGWNVRVFRTADEASDWLAAVVPPAEDETHTARGA